MKKYIYLACAMLLGAFASCSQSETGDETPQSNQVILKAIADQGLQTRTGESPANRFAIEVYTDAAYTTPANVLAGETTNKASNATGEFAMVLDRTQEYYCLLWADKDGAAVYDIATANGLKGIALTGKAVEAWQGTIMIEAEKTATLSATLTRAVSKLSLMETAELNPGTLTLNFNQPTTFNVADGTATGSTARPEESVTIATVVDGSATAVKLNTNDIFVLSSVATADLTDLTFQYENEVEFIVPQAPLKANFNTNIKGHYTSTTYPTFTATCDDEWGANDNSAELPDPGARFIEVNGIKVATGYLVANGPNSAKIGLPDADDVLFFQFGSLVGWDQSVAIAVTPKAFNGDTSYTSMDKTWRGTEGTVPFTTADSDEEKAGVGDPCRYYLKGTWRLPTKEELNTIFDGYGSADSPWAWNETSNSATHTSGLIFSNSGYIYPSFVNTGITCWSATPDTRERDGYLALINSSGIRVDTNNKGMGNSARCVCD